MTRTPTTTVTANRNRGARVRMGHVPRARISPASRRDDAAATAVALACPCGFPPGMAGTEVRAVFSLSLVSRRCRMTGGRALCAAAGGTTL